MDPGRPLEFACTFPSCGKVFRTESDQKRHEQIHLPKHERTYFSCTYKGCKKRYVSKSSLQSHINNKHLGIKVECRVEGCHVLLADSSSRSHHEKKSHGDPLFVCEMCSNNKFYTKEGLKIHRTHCLSRPNVNRQDPSINDHIQAHSSTHLQNYGPSTNATHFPPAPQQFASHPPIAEYGSHSTFPSSSNPDANSYLGATSAIPDRSTSHPNIGYALPEPGQATGLAANYGLPVLRSQHVSPVDMLKLGSYFPTSSTDSTQLDALSSPSRHSPIYSPTTFHPYRRQEYAHGYQAGVRSSSSGLMQSRTVNHSARIAPSRFPAPVQVAGPMSATQVDTLSPHQNQASTGTPCLPLTTWAPAYGSTNRSNNQGDPPNFSPENQGANPCGPGASLSTPFLPWTIHDPPANDPLSFPSSASYVGPGNFPLSEHFGERFETPYPS
ncbi:hypothetical protein BS47DRAFT_801663 [Hydnum rufescens UP504]|uniref:C2H2-type domain-containing protein n=1 Tax=Hydnum rufescens UP504 TaxID=1448309 RepID=A0A9P6B0F1_9AGAM|nr:hypothetical protein BS47DRAFT_801663 [Hydnum rufescens UP504]